MHSSVNNINYYTSLNIHWDKKWKFSLTFNSNTHVTIINLTRVVTLQLFKICIRYVLPYVISSFRKSVFWCWFQAALAYSACWPNEWFVCLFLDVSVADVDIEYDKTDDAICLRTDIVDVLCPPHIWCESLGELWRQSQCDVGKLALLWGGKFLCT